MSDMNVTHRDYNRNFRYIPFDQNDSPLFKEEGNRIFTLPHKGEGVSAKEKILESKNLPQQEKEDFFSGREVVLEQAVSGKDGREEIKNPTEHPNRMYVKLRIKFKGNFYGGSGTLVGPNHVLTCGHNVFDHDDKMGWAEQILAYPAKTGNSSPFGEAEVVRVYTFDAWEKEEEETLDIALLVLSRTFKATCGWGSVLSIAEKNDPLFKESFGITGYPGDKVGDGDTYKGHRMWTMTHTLKETENIDTFEYLHDTFRGQSGSPIWHEKGDSIEIIGVHTTGKEKVENSGVRITALKIKELVIRGIKETYTPVPTEAKEADSKELKQQEKPPLPTQKFTVEAKQGGIQFNMQGDGGQQYLLGSKQGAPQLQSRAQGVPSSGPSGNQEYKVTSEAGGLQFNALGDNASQVVSSEFVKDVKASQDSQDKGKKPSTQENLDGIL